MTTTYDYAKFFPHEAARVEQDVSIVFALDAFLAQNKRFVVLELGTGCGKSAIGLTIGRYLNSVRDVTKEHSYLPGSYVLTTQKVLQEQYAKDFGPPTGGLISIKSAANYGCEFFKNNTCSESIRALKGERKGSPFWNKCMLDCCYKHEKQRFLSSIESVTNFSYFLAETMYGGKILPRDLLILDEAHNIEASLSSFIEVTISEKFATETLKLEWVQPKSDTAAIAWLTAVYEPALKDKIAHVEMMISKLKLEEKLKDFENVARQYEMLDQHICKLHRFLKLWSEDNWVMNEIRAEGKSLRKLEFKPVDVSPYSNDMLFKFGRHVLMMSATIVNRDVFCDTVGVSRDDVAFLSLDSPFPVQNRPIVYAPVGSMAQNDIDASLPKLVEMVKLILDEHKKEKGIIHAHTFRIANFIKKNIKSNRLLIHDSSNRDEVIQKHMQSKAPTVLISPSLSEGIDLKDDLSRFQVICKVPYPYLGDKLVKKRMLKNKQWYPYQTAKTVVQSVGRSIRNEDDHAVTYILDDNWERFFRQNSHLLPDSFRKALKM